MIAVLLRTCLIVLPLCAWAGTLAAEDAEAPAAESPARLLHAAHEAFFEFADEELRFRSVFALRSTGQPLAEIKFAIPEDVQIDSVEAPHLESYVVDADAYELNVSLVTHAAGHETITIEGRIEFDPEIELDAILLPVLEPLDAERESGRLHLFAPAGLNLRVDREFASGAVPIVARPQPMPPGYRHVVSWGYRRRPVELLVETASDPLRMTAAIETRANVRPEYVELHSHVAYRIESGLADTFQIAVSPAVADDVRIEPCGDTAVAQITRGEPLEDGWVPWTIITREPQDEGVAFDIRTELSPDSSNRPIVLIAHETVPVPADGSAAEPARHITIEPVRVLEPMPATPTASVLRRIAGRFTVWRESGLDVEVESPSRGVWQAAPRESSGAAVAVGSGDGNEDDSQHGRVALVESYAYGQSPVQWDVSWAPALPPRRPADIREGRVEIALPASRSGGWADYRCAYELLPPRGDGLSVEIPADESGTETLQASCNGQPLLPVPEGEAGGGSRRYRIDLPAATSAVDEPVSLVLMFRVKLAAPPFRGFGSALELPLPQIGRDWMVPNLETVVWIPDGFALVGTPLGFAPLSVPSRAASTVPGRFAGRLDSPASLQTAASPAAGHAYVYRRTGNDDLLVVHWWNMRVATWVLSGAVLFAALILRPTSWRNRLTLVLWIAFGVTMAAVASPDAVAHGLFAARFGLVAGLLLWVLKSLPAPAPSIVAGKVGPALAPDQPAPHAPIRAGAA